MIELIEVPHLTERHKVNPRRTPWIVNADVAVTVQRLFPKWMKERHGIVVYECHLMDSSSCGNQSFMPRMFEAEDDQIHPAPPFRNTELASTIETPVHWVWLPPGASDEDIIEKLDACFAYELVSPADGGSPYRRLMSGKPLNP